MVLSVQHTWQVCARRVSDMGNRNALHRQRVNGNLLSKVWVGGIHMVATLAVGLDPKLCPLAVGACVVIMSHRNFRTSA